MVRYDGLLNPFHSLNFGRLTHPTNFATRNPTTICGSVTHHLFDKTVLPQYSIELELKSCLKRLNIKMLRY